MQWVAGFITLLVLASSIWARPRPKPLTLDDAPRDVAISGAMWRVDPAGGKAVEVLRIKDEGLGRPAVAGDTVYVASLSRDVYAVDAVSGEKKWQYAANADVYSLAVAPKGIFVGTAKSLVALDPAQGKPLWTYPSGGAVADPMPADGLILYNTFDGPVAVEQETGKLRWQMDLRWSYFVYSPLSEGRLCIWKPDEIYVVDSERGKTLWQSAAEMQNTAPGALQSAAVGAGNVICQLRGAPKDARDWSLHALDAGSGKSLWTARLGDHRGAGARTLIAPHGIYCTLDDLLIALDPRTGDKRWEATIKAPLRSGPAMLFDDTTLYIPETGGDLLALDANTGKEKWRSEAPEAAEKGMFRFAGAVRGAKALFITRNEVLRVRE